MADKKKVTKLMKLNFSFLDNLSKLKQQKEKSNSKVDFRRYDIAFNEVMLRFGYIIDIHSSRYRNFPNYQDIWQEGQIGLSLAVEKFKPERSKNFFRLANWYVKTRIKRSANKHGVVSIPITSTEKLIINRINNFDFIENNETPLSSFEKEDTLLNLREAVNLLSSPYKDLVCLYYGLNNEKMTKS